MATPNDPSTPRDPHRPLSRPRPDRGAAGWAWVVIIIVIVVIFWMAMGGHGRRSRTLANPAGHNPDSAQQASNPVTDPGQLTAPNAKDLVGQPVDLARAQVSHSANGGAFLIDAGGKPLLVVEATAANSEDAGMAHRPAETNGGAWKKDHPAGGGQVHDNGAGQIAQQGKGTPEGAGNAPPLSQENTHAFNQGDIVSVQGTVRQMPSEHDAMTRFNLSTDEAARVSKSKVYIEASSVQPAAK